jgi:hypothetical protein
LLQIRLLRITGKYVGISNIILLTVIMSSGCILSNVPIKSAYALCKGLVPTSLTIGFAPIGPKFDQPAGYMISGYLKAVDAGFPPPAGKIVKINSVSPKISGSTTTDSKGHYMFIVHPQLGQYKVIATVGSDPECGYCPESFCIHGSFTSGILTQSQSTQGLKNNNR